MSSFFGLFAKKVDDGYGGTMYELKDAGYTALVVIAIVFLIIGVSIFGSKKKMSTKKMAFSAMAMALALLTSFAKLYSFPMGGSITLFSMLFISLIGFWYGLGTGLTVGVAYGILQMLVDPYIISIPQMLIDYIFAFGALGLSGAIPSKIKEMRYGIVPAYILSVLGRYAFAFLSGWLFFSEYASDWGFTSGALYSLAYNGIYLGAECALTVVVLLIPAVRNALNKVQADAVS